MQRVRTTTAIPDNPGYTAGGTPGYFTEGNPSASLPATVPGADWCNMLQEELINVILATGMTPDPEDDTQLDQAIDAKIAAAAPTIGQATTSAQGIVERATTEEVVAGVDTERYVCPADLLAALLAGLAGVARLAAVGAYTRQQYPVPVARTGASGSQAVDMKLHQLLSITATGDIAFAEPEHLIVGKSATILVYSAASVALTWDAAYIGQSGYALPGATTAGKWLVMGFLCHKAGALLLTGVAEEA